MRALDYLCLAIGLSLGFFCVGPLLSALWRRPRCCSHGPVQQWMPMPPAREATRLHLGDLAFAVHLGLVTTNEARQIADREEGPVETTRLCDPEPRYLADCIGCGAPIFPTDVQCSYCARPTGAK